jgi:hypothetical protein
MQTITKQAAARTRGGITIDNALDQLSLFGVDPDPKPAPAPKATKPLPTPIKSVAAAPKRPVAITRPDVSGEMVKTLTGGALWQMEQDQCVAYVKDANVACELLGIERRRLDKHLMAAYYDNKDKAFAWQVTFERSEWGRAVKLLSR